MKCFRTKNSDSIAFILFPVFFFFNYFLFFDLIFFSSVLCHLSKLLFCSPSLPSSFSLSSLFSSSFHLFCFHLSFKQITYILSHFLSSHLTSYIHSSGHIIHSSFFSIPSFLFLLIILIPCTL